MQTHLFFPTPIVQDTIESDLEQYVIDLSRTDEGVKLSNRGGYQSKHFQKPEKEFEDLWVAIEERLNIYHEKVSLRGRVEINEWWFNINYRGCMNRLHQHPNSIHSGVYYVKVPENSGVIRFWDPRGPLMHVQRDNEYFNHSASSYDITPEPGLLLYFPTWLEHDVTPNETDEDRITISFNINADTSGKTCYK